MIWINKMSTLRPKKFKNKYPVLTWEVQLTCKVSAGQIRMPPKNQKRKLVPAWRELSGQKLPHWQQLFFRSPKNGTSASSCSSELQLQDSLLGTVLRFLGLGAVWMPGLGAAELLPVGFLWPRHRLWSANETLLKKKACRKDTLQFLLVNK